MKSFEATKAKLEEVRMGINLVDGQEYKSTLAAISTVTAEILCKTLGPYASTTTIDDGTYTYPTKDGWAVCNRLRFGDDIQNTLFKFIRDISFRLNSKVGDGTTTAIIAANKFIAELKNLMDEQKLYSETSGQYKVLRQADLIDEINKAKDEIIKELTSPERCKLIDINNDAFEDIYKIAYVSSNRNEEIARIIQEIYQKTQNPNIHVTMNGAEKNTYAEIQKGYKLDAELLWSRYYVNTTEKTSVYNTPVTVVMFNHNVTYAEHMQIIGALMQRARNMQRDIIIMAPYYDEIVRSIIGSQVENLAKNGQTATIALVKVPMQTSSQKNYAKDFAAILNAQMFDYSRVRMYAQMLREKNGESKESDEFAGMLKNTEFKEPEDVFTACEGTANKLTLSSKFALIEDFDKGTKSYQLAAEEIKREYDEAKDSVTKGGNNLDKKYLDAHLRYIKFIGDTGIIKVGGDSDLTKQCLKDSIDDAVLACRSAFENGFVRGLNLETISVSYWKYREIMDKYDDDSIIPMNDWIRAHVYMTICHTFIETSKEVMRNKYRDDDIGDDEYLWTEDHLSMEEVLVKCIDDNLCFDIVSEEFEPAGETLVNSVATDIEILTAMTSMLSLLMSSDQLLSLSKLYDRKAGREQALKDKFEIAEAYGSGIASALIKRGCMFFDDESGCNCCDDDDDFGDLEGEEFNDISSLSDKVLDDGEDVE